MPEILTKHPKIVMDLLSEMGAKCQLSASPSILTDCPSKNFCSLPGGELCVLGLNDVNRLTQFNANIQTGGQTCTVWLWFLIILFLFLVLFLLQRYQNRQRQNQEQ